MPVAIYHCHFCSFESFDDGGLLDKIGHYLFQKHFIGFNLIKLMGSLGLIKLR